LKFKPKKINKKPLKTRSRFWILCLGRWSTRARPW